MKNTQRKTSRVAVAFMAGALCSLIAGAAAQSASAPTADNQPASADVDPIFQSAPPSPAPATRVDVEVNDGTSAAPSATITAPADTQVQVQVQPAATAPQLPVQPLASDPTALQQLEQSINAQQQAAPAPGAPGDSTRPIVRNNPALMTPYTVPRSAEGIFEDSDLTLREISYLAAERDRLNAMSERENAFVTQINARRAVIDALESPTQAQVREEEKAKQAADRALEAEQARPAAGLAAAAAPAPQPFVNSIYSYDNKSYAEIFIGANKVVATEGTVLVTGERVVSITPEGVVISGRKGRKTLRVIGTAGTSM